MSTKQTNPRKKTLGKRFRQANWTRHVGAQRGTTLCLAGCGKEITQFDFECGHIVAEARGGATSHDNIVPICAMCNRSMGAESMIEYCARHGWTPLVDLSRLATPQSAPSATTPARAPAAAPVEFHIHTMDISAYLRGFKRLPQLDRALGQYKRAVDARLRDGADYVGDDKFHRQFIYNFLLSQFGALHYPTYMSDWGTPESGVRLATSLLQHLKQFGCSLADRVLVQNRVEHLDAVLIEYLKTMRANIPNLEITRGQFGTICVRERKPRAPHGK